MFVRKYFSIKGLVMFSGGHVVWLTVWMSLVTSLYYFFEDLEWLALPWLPISVIGTAVAFYIGFKNNQAYDRLWEARKIWGAIVNSSRAWGSAVRGFVSNDFSDKPISDQDLKNLQQKLIYRHIGWLYSLRSQLLIPTPWEHINQSFLIARVARKRIKRFGVGLLDDDVTQKNLKKFLGSSEYERLINYKKHSYPDHRSASSRLERLEDARLD